MFNQTKNVATRKLDSTPGNLMRERGIRRPGGFRPGGPAEGVGGGAGEGGQGDVVQGGAGGRDDGGGEAAEGGGGGEEGVRGAFEGGGEGEARQRGGAEGVLLLQQREVAGLRLLPSGKLGCSSSRYVRFLFFTRSSGLRATLEVL